MFINTYDSNGHPITIELQKIISGFDSVLWSRSNLDRLRLRFRLPVPATGSNSNSRLRLRKQKFLNTSFRKKCSFESK